MRPADLDKLILDVQNGLYPVNGMEVSKQPIGFANQFGTEPKQPIEPEQSNVCTKRETFWWNFLLIFQESRFLFLPKNQIYQKQCLILGWFDFVLQKANFI